MQPVRARGSGAVGVVAVALVAVTGCAPAADQTLRVSYGDSGSVTEASVQFSSLQCRELGGSLTIGSGERAENGPSTLAVVVNEDVGTHAVLLQLSDDLWFSADGEFAAATDSVTFDDLIGSVGPLNEGGTAVVPVDRDATLSGTLTCAG